MFIFVAWFVLALVFGIREMIIMKRSGVRKELFLLIAVLVVIAFAGVTSRAIVELGLGIETLPALAMSVLACIAVAYFLLEVAWNKIRRP